MSLEPTIDDRQPLAGATDESIAGEADDGLVEEELLVEEISIDGMCGVY